MCIIPRHDQTSNLCPFEQTGQTARRDATHIKYRRHPKPNLCPCRRHGKEPVGEGTITHTLVPDDKDEIAVPQAHINSRYHEPLSILGPFGFSAVAKPTAGRH